LKVIGAHQFLFYSDYLYVLGASILTVKENTEASVFVSNEIGLELNEEKTKYMVMSRNQHAVQNHNIYHHHHMFVMQLGHLLTCSGLTYLEVSSEVCHNSFCQLGNSVSFTHTHTHIYIYR